MAGLIASGIIKWTASKLSFLVSATAGLSSDESNAAFEDLKKLQRMMLRVQRTLDSANEREIRDHTERLRLRELQEVAYDAEDAVDEYKYELLRSRIEARDNNQSGGSHLKRKREGDDKVLSTITYPVKVPVPKELATRAKKIMERFNEITRAWDALHLRDSDAPQLGDDYDMTALSTTHFVHEPSIVGREEDKENVIKMLLSEDGASAGPLAVIPIVGMGGVGKTTLAQLVYNDRRISKYFHARGWVHVPEDFDVKAITSNIIMSLTCRKCEITELCDLQEMLTEEVRGMKFLLVLDDVWNETQGLWDALRAPLLSAQSGKIIVTTRNERVSMIMRTIPPYHVSCLPFDESWYLFKQLAFGCQDLDARGEFEELGRKIVAKCGGLPLAVKAIGSALRFETNEETWNDILESGLWELEMRENKVLPALRLSYNRMPVHLKRCFVFLALLPKGFYFLKDNVINLWMSLGVLKQEGRKRIENIGGRYFDDLIQRSMFQRTRSNEGFDCFVMHDLVNDLAQYVAGNDFLRIDDQCLSDVSGKLRYLSLSVSSSDANIDLQYLQVPGGLRILQVVNATDNTGCYSKLFSFNIKVTIPDDLLRSFRQLRALDFSHTGITTLPDSIGELKLLRYLCLFKTEITSIPESVSGLYNLKVLDARTHNLREIPQGIGNLVSLRHLNLDPSFALCMPRGIGQLTKLQSLSRFSVGDGSWHCGIVELHSLVRLRGELSITGLRNIRNVTDAETANLCSKQHLQDLRLDWSNGIWADRCSHGRNQNNATVIPELEDAVFEKMRPHRDLRELAVLNYGGYRYPSWLGDASFLQLAKITLAQHSCEFLPPLGRLPCLRNLFIQLMTCVERVRREFCARDMTTKGFPALEELEFEDMPKWVEWSGVAEGEFPSLHELRIKECHELRFLPQPLSSSLTKLVIKNCDKLLRLPAIPNLNSLVLRGELNEGILCDLHLPLLKALKVSLSRNLAYIPLSSQNLPSLEVLAIRACRQLQSVVGLSSIRSLKLLNIIGCPNLQLPFNQPLPPQLQRLTILRCPKLQEWHEFQTVRCKDQLQGSGDASDEELEALEVLREDTDDEVGEEYLDLSEEDDGDDEEQEEDLGRSSEEIDNDDDDDT